ncbi:MAG: two-component system response regulator [Acidobacteria bacterium]|nr:MAG: two-component system response regulator [Acidobacteriota bacterium]
MKLQTLLLVDDTPENIDVLKGILSSSYKLKVALHGKRAIEIATSAPPDLILLDIMMPEMDGYEVCRILKSNHKTQNIPIIFVTAKSEETDEFKGFNAGAVDYIRKPVSPVLVKARIKTHLALSDQNRVLELKVKERTEELEATRLEIIRRLGRAAEYKDNETGLHVIRMSYYAEHIAIKAGLPKEAATMILNAAPMHDIGKIGIPDYILSKRGKLTDEEWKIMRTHPQIGADIIGHHESGLLKLARTIALTHHEKWDGTGYPKGLKGEEIPLASRIVSIADTFDALTSERPYKQAWPVEKAIEVIQRDSGSYFEPTLVDAFMSCIDEVLATKDRYKETGGTTF